MLSSIIMVGLPTGIFYGINRIFSPHENAKRRSGVFMMATTGVIFTMSLLGTALLLEDGKKVSGSSFAGGLVGFALMGNAGRVMRKPSKSKDETNSHSTNQ